MHQFCFNDCIPYTSNDLLLTECLQKTLTEYKEVKKSFPDNVDGIISSKSVSDIFLNANNFSLGACIASVRDKDLRTFAYHIFTKYPIEEYYTEVNVDDLLEKEYSINVAGTNHSAINPVIVSGNNGVLFTLGLHDDLKKNVLSISSNTNITVNVNNLFGTDENTTFIKSFIHQLIVDKLGNFEKLLELVGENSCSSRFIKGFHEEPYHIQVSIIEHIKEAIARNGKSKFFADGRLIKDVTPDKFDHRIFELRIFTPVAFRVYFYETTAKIYLALIERKPPPKKQDNHIMAATSIIKQMIYLEQYKF